MNNSILNTAVFSDSIPNDEDYWKLFLTTGWNEEYNFSIEELSHSIQNSWFTTSIYHQDNLIGFGRILSDGIHHALIIDLIIHPDYQNMGLGSKLLDRLVTKCKLHNIRDIQLFAAKNKYAFYEKFGFKTRPADAPGMQLTLRQQAD